MKDEIIEVLKILQNSDRLITIKDLANKMGISKSKAKLLIKDAMNLLPTEIAIINSKVGSGQGYSITIFDEDSFQKYIDKKLKLINSYETREVRIFNILDKLLTNDYIKADELSEELYISKTQLTKDLKIVRQLLEEYDLKVNSVPYYGLSVEGNEFNKRLCMSNYLQKDVHFDWEQISFINEILPSEIKEGLGNILYSQLKNENYNVSENAFQSLVTHLSIMLLRVKKNKRIMTESIDRHDILMNTQLFNMSKNILEEIEKEFNIKFGIGEQMYLTIHLAGKRYWESDSNVVISQEISTLTNKMLEHIKEEFHIDLFDSLNFRIQLNLHILPLTTRIKYNLSMLNPLLDEIKTRFVYEFDIALSACKIIENEYNCILSEDEVSYIALYLGMELDRNKVVDKKNALLVCQSGKISSVLLKSKLLEKFNKYINDIDICLLIELKDIDLSKYGYIFTTIPIKRRVDIPIINIEYFLMDNEYESIENILKKDEFEFNDFFNSNLFISKLEGKNKNDIILEMVEIIKKQIELPDNFYDDVIEREKSAPTDFGYKVALPHPKKPINLDTFVCVGVLPKPILWTNRKVQIIFLISVKKKSADSIQKFYKAITNFIGNKELVDQFLEEPTFHKLEKLLTK